ncbi:MAG: hypothetical protein KKC21_06090 [Nitrospinae bacterium]|nr:hypothetical protein [Nitrospinota bacterium]
MSSCTNERVDSQNPETALSLIQAMEAGRESIFLKDVVDFEWEMACVILPYEYEKTVNSMLGFEYKDFNKLHWINDEQHWGILFVDVRRAVTSIPINRFKTADYASHVSQKKCVSKQAAKLVLTVKNGRKAYRLDEM